MPEYLFSQRKLPVTCIGSLLQRSTKLKIGWKARTVLFRRLLWHTKLSQDQVNQTHSITQKSGRVQDCCAVYLPYNINSLQSHWLRGLRLKAEAWHIHRSQRFHWRGKISKIFSSLLCCCPSWPKNASLKGLGKEDWDRYKALVTLLFSYSATMNHPAQKLLWKVYFSEQSFIYKIRFYKVRKPQINLSSLKMMIVSSQYLSVILQKAQEQ